MCAQEFRVDFLPSPARRRYCRSGTYRRLASDRSLYIARHPQVVVPDVVLGPNRDSVVGTRPRPARRWRGPEHEARKPLPINLDHAPFPAVVPPDHLADVAAEHLGEGPHAVFVRFFRLEELVQSTKQVLDALDAHLG